MRNCVKLSNTEIAQLHPYKYPLFTSNFFNVQLQSALLVHMSTYPCTRILQI